MVGDDNPDPRPSPFETKDVSISDFPIRDVPDRDVSNRDSKKPEADFRNNAVVTYTELHKNPPEPPPNNQKRKHGILDRFPELRNLFLQHLARYGNVASAARRVRISQATAEQYIKRNPEFAAQVEEAHAIFNSKVEEEIYRRAVEGVDEPKFNQGIEVGTVRKYSDTLLLALAKRRMPEYREQRNVSGSIKHEHEHRASIDAASLTPEQRAALRTLLDPTHTPEIPTTPPEKPRLGVEFPDDDAHS